MEEKYNEIDLIELVKVVLKKWWLLLALFILGSSSAYYYTTYSIKPIYEASTTLFIGKEPGELSNLGISMSELQVSYQLINDYTQIVKTRLVAEAVIENLGLNISPEAFRGSATIAPIGVSRLCAVSFRSTDPVFAANIANEYSRQLSIAVAEIVGVENIRIIDEALPPIYPITPRPLMNALIAGIIGLIFGLFLILLLRLLNNTIQKEEEIEMLIGVPVLAIIPKFKGEKRL